MHIKYYPIRGTGDKRAYIVKNVKGTKTREIVEKYQSVDELTEKYGDAEKFLKSRVEELESLDRRAIDSVCSITIDTETCLNAAKETKLWRNMGYLILQKAYYDLGIESFLNKWKHDSKAKFAYSLNDAFRLMVYSRVIDPCSKLATARKQEDYVEGFSLSEDDLYDCLGRSDAFSDKLTRRLSLKCRELLPGSEEGGGDAIYYDCTNFYFECQGPDGDDGLRDYGVEKNHRPDPIVEYGLLLDGGGFPIGSCCFRGNESEKRSLLPLLHDAGEDSTKAKIIVADAGLNTEANKDAIHGSGRNYVFCQSPKALSKENAARAIGEGGWKEYDGGRKKVKSAWVKRSNGREERLVVRFDRASADFVNAAIDKRLNRAKALIKNPSSLSFSKCQDGKEYIKKLYFDSKTGEIVKEKSELIIDSAKVEGERKWAGYMLYVTDIPRQSDLDGEFAKMKREGYRVEPMDDLQIVKIAGKRNDIEACFREMKTSMSARPIFVRTAEHIRGHLFTVYVALTIVMYLRKKYASDMTPDRFMEAIRRCGVALIDEKKKLYQSTYYSQELETMRKSTELALLNRKYLTWPMLKEMISESKGR